jgi:hypothetical protein
MYKNNNTTQEYDADSAKSKHGTYWLTLYYLSVKCKKNEQHFH